jgi:hypothetical protein
MIEDGEGLGYCRRSSLDFETLKAGFARNPDNGVRRGKCKNSREAAKGDSPDREVGDREHKIHREGRRPGTLRLRSAIYLEECRSFGPLLWSRHVFPDLTVGAISCRRFAAVDRNEFTILDERDEAR